MRRGLRHAYSRGARFHQNYQVRSFDASVAGVSNISATFPGSRGIGINPKWPLTCPRTNVLASGSHAERLNSIACTRGQNARLLHLALADLPGNTESIRMRNLEERIYWMRLDGTIRQVWQTGKLLKELGTVNAIDGRDEIRSIWARSAIWGAEVGAYGACG